VNVTRTAQTKIADQLKALESVEMPIRKYWDSDFLRIVAFSDYRVQDIAVLLDYLREMEPAPHLLLYAGDDVERFRNGPQNLFAQLAAIATHGLCGVVGNDTEASDEGRPKRIRFVDEVKKAREYVQGHGVYNVHCSPLIIGNYAVIGNEGSIPDASFGTLGTVIYPESSVSRHLVKARKAVAGKHLILVSHTPPKGALDLAIRFGTRHIGSAALRKFILKSCDVPLVICGHAHFSGAQSMKLGRSIVVNAASHDDSGAPGRIAIIEMRAGKVLNVRWHLLWELGSIPGIGEARATRLRREGINTVHQLAETSEHAIAMAIKGGRSEGLLLRARALSLCKQEIVQVGKLDMPNENRAYLDLETHIQGEFIWLIGLHLENENKTYSLYAANPQQEKQILIDMLRLLNERPGLNILSYSGTRFEQRMIAKRLAAHDLAYHIAKSIRDIYHDIHSCMAFPTQGLKLKDIAKWCGFKWRQSEMNGFETAMLYGSSGNLTKAAKRKVIQYNEDDLLALKHVLLRCTKMQELESVGAKTPRSL
jgi:uncharacterized protein YprB with RNaseH-like and TPR domain